MLVSVPVSVPVSVSVPVRFAVPAVMLDDMTASAKDILAELRRSPTQKVKVAVTDIDGVMRGKYLHKDKFLSAAEGGGFGFCNVVFGWDSADVCYDNATYTGWHTGYPDAVARVDLSTARTVPWDGGVPFFLADFEDGRGGPLPVCPRSLLKKIVARAQDAGFMPKAGLEFEWFNFQETPESLAAKQYVSPKPLTPGMFGYSLVRMANSRPFFNAMLDELGAFGVPIEGLHTETGPGVFEAAIQAADALEAADRGVLFKTSVKEIGQRFQVMPTFMAKWNSALPGCSGHMHQSLWTKNGNAFDDDKDPRRMSKVFKSYLAGQLRGLADLLPFFAPTVNSYKRLVARGSMSGFTWAPIFVCYGSNNRTNMIRIPMNGPRIECRAADISCNLYLGAAMMLMAGLEGIREKLDPGDPHRENMYLHTPETLKSMGIEHLPRTLGEAVDAFEADPLSAQVMGPLMFDAYVKFKRAEWVEYHTHVSDWEIARYLKFF